MPLNYLLHLFQPVLALPIWIVPPPCKRYEDSLHFSYSSDLEQDFAVVSFLRYLAWDRSPWCRIHTNAMVSEPINILLYASTLMPVLTFRNLLYMDWIRISLYSHQSSYRMTRLTSAFYSSSDTYNSRREPCPSWSGFGAWAVNLPWRIQGGYGDNRCKSSKFYFPNAANGWAGEIDIWGSVIVLVIRGTTEDILANLMVAHRSVCITSNCMSCGFWNYTASFISHSRSTATPDLSICLRSRYSNEIEVFL